ncbi:helix-turn-helix domain-containing protein [Nonomuraea dietziae]
MDATAKRARVTRRTVYLHFPARADLLRALYDHVAEVEGLADSIRPVLSAPDAITALDRACWRSHGPSPMPPTCLGRSKLPPPAAGP